MDAEPEYEACSRAKRQYEGGNVQGAVDTLEEYLRTDPHNCKARLHLAQYAIYGLKNMDYGMMQLDAILDIDPDYSDAILAQVTVMAKNKKYNKETNDKFSKLVELDPSAEMYNQYARFLRNQMLDFPKAKEYYELAIEKAPSKPEYRQNYAALLLNDLKDYQEAKNQLEVLMKMKPEDAVIKKNYDRLMKERFDKDGNLRPERRFFGLIKKR